jgi:hypothetical protein
LVQGRREYLSKQKCTPEEKTVSAGLSVSVKAERVLVQVLV